MAPKKSAQAPLTLELHGKLTRVVLDEVTFSANRLVAAGTSGQASISANNEVGISDSGDSYFVSVTIEVQALSEEGQKPMYSVKVKGTGFYTLAAKITPEERERVADQANIRSSLQVYPEVRRLVLGLVAGGGYNLKLPIEPDFFGIVIQKTKEKDQPAVAAQA